MNKQNQQKAEPTQAKTAKQEIQAQETAVSIPVSFLQHPHTITPAAAKTLQRTIGNQALHHLLLQRQEEEKLQAKGNPMLAGGELSNDIESSVQNAKSGGAPIADAVRQPMEQAFNTDFSSVKIHTGSTAHMLNQSLSARAFTSGQDIFFRNGAYNPGNTSGQELLAHELTHTVQQGSSTPLQRQADKRPFTTTSPVTHPIKPNPQVEINTPAKLNPGIQRYTITSRNQIGPGGWDGLDRSQFWRVSDDEKMVVKDSEAGGAGGPALQYYYATSTVFQNGKDILDGIGSGFTLNQDMGEAVKSPGNKHKLYRVKPTNKDQKDPQADTGTFRNCDENTRHALGMHRSTGENPFRSVGVDATIFNTPMPALNDQGQATVNSIMGILSQYISGTDTVPQVLQGEITLADLVKLNYKNMPEDARRILSTAIGVNQGADPNVGEGVTVINPTSGVGHFAPAIGRSGSDWVSLENDTDQQGNAEDNQNWYMRMYGALKMSEDNKTVISDQTFYGEQKRSGGYGAEPIVMKIVPIEKKPETVEEARAMQKKKTQDLALSLTSQNVIGSHYVVNSSEWHRNFVERVRQESQAIADDTPYLEQVLAWEDTYKDAPELDGFKEKMSRSAARLIAKTVVTLRLIQQHIDTLPQPDTI